MKTAEEIEVKNKQEYDAWRTRLHASFENLNIVAEIERHGGTQLTPISQYNPRQYSGPCPWYLNCPPGDTPCDADDDGFLVWPTLDRELCNGDMRPKHYWCRKCRRSGDIANFLERYYKISIPQACALLEINPNDENATPVDISRIQKRGRSGPTEEQVRVVAMLTRIYPYAQQMLTHPRSLAYLAARAIPLEIAQALGVSYIPARSEGVEVAESYDQWCDKILFPAQSSSGEQGFRGRTLTHWLPGMDESEHRDLLAALNIAPWLATYGDCYFNAHALSQASCPVFVEGGFDALACQAAGIQAVPVGTSRLPSLRQVRQVILALDSDESGRVATEWMQNNLRALGVGFRLCVPPDGTKDWSEAYRLFGAQGFLVLQESLQRLQFCEGCDLSTFSSKKPFQEYNGHLYCSFCYPDSAVPSPAPPPPVQNEAPPEVVETSTTDETSLQQEDCPQPLKEYKPVSLPTLPRVKCPCVVLDWNKKKDQVKQHCMNRVTSNGFCEEHQSSYRFLEIGALFGYPEVVIPFEWKGEPARRTIPAGVQQWEDRACISSVERPHNLSDNIKYLENVLRRKENNQ